MDEVASASTPLVDHNVSLDEIAEEDKSLVQHQQQSESASESGGYRVREHLKSLNHVLCRRCVHTLGYHSLRQVGYDRDGNAVLYMCFGQDKFRDESVGAEVYNHHYRTHVKNLLEAARYRSDSNTPSVQGIVWYIDMQGFWSHEIHTLDNLVPTDIVGAWSFVQVYILNAQGRWREETQRWIGNRDIPFNVQCVEPADLVSKLSQDEIGKWILAETRRNNKAGRGFMEENENSLGWTDYVTQEIDSFFTNFHNHVPHPSLVKRFLDEQDGQEKNFIVQDAHITGDGSSGKRDCLGYQDYAQELVSLLVDSDVPTGITVGIYGNWGKGKTFLLDQLTNEVEAKNNEAKTKTSFHKAPCCSIKVPFLAYLILLVLLFMCVATGACVVMFWFGLKDMPSPVFNTSAVTTTQTPASPVPVLTWLGTVGLIFVVLVIATCCMCILGKYSSSVSLEEINKLFVLLLCKKPQHPEKVDSHSAPLEIIQVNFNAWEYAGSDFLWAGIVTNLCSAVEKKFGYWKTRLFRVVEADVSEQLEDLVQKDTNKSGQPVDQAKRVGQTSASQSTMGHSYDAQTNCYSVPVEDRTVIFDSLPKYLGWLGFCTFVFVSIMTIIIYSTVLSTVDIAVILQAVSGGLLGAATLSQIISVYNISKSLYTSQAERISNLQQQMTGPQFEEQLGFMHKIRMEVLLVQHLVAFMECLYQKRFRILLVIDDLDRVEDKKILKILEAINILLSDDSSPFISVIAIDPRIVVKAVEQSFSQVLLDANINGHEYLKKIVQLPFCIPDITGDKVCDFLNQKLEAIQLKSHDRRTALPSASNGNPALSNAPAAEGNGIPLKKDVVDGTAKNAPPRDDGSTVASENPLILALNQYKLQPELVFANPRNMTRICNILLLVMKLIERSNKQGSQRPIKDVRDVAWWVLLTEQWPYRISWLIQIYEDTCQLATIFGTSVDKDRLLLDVYEENEKKLSTPADWKPLLSLDYDPELFTRFLQIHQFKLKDLENFLPYTVNLDHSLKTTIAATLAQFKITEHRLVPLKV